MARLTIELSDELQASAKARAEQSGHVSVEEYLRSLLSTDIQSPDDEAMEKLLLARLDDGPSIEATPEFWRSLRDEIA